METGDIYSTEEKRKEALLNLKSLVEHPGWKLLRQIFQFNIDFARKQLEEGTGEKDETKADVDRIRDRLKVYRDCMDAPDDQIKNLEQTEQEVPELDPFVTVDQLRKDRGEPVEKEEDKPEA